MKYTRERVNSLYQIIKESDEELAEIRKDCDHKDFHIGNYGDYRGFSSSRICNECDGFICFVDDKGNETKHPFNETKHPVVTTSTDNIL